MHCSWSNNTHYRLLPCQLQMNNKDPTAFPSPPHLFLPGLHIYPTHSNKKRTRPRASHQKKTIMSTVENVCISQANSCHKFKCNWTLLIKILTMICNVINPPLTLLHLWNRLSIPFYDYLCKTYNNRMVNWIKPHYIINNHTDPHVQVLGSYL